MHSLKNFGFVCAFLTFLVGNVAFIQAQALVSEDQQVVKLFSQVEKQMKAKSEFVKQDFQTFVDYCLSKNNDTSLVAGIDLITDYYLEDANYFEAIRWYSFACDSLCQNKIGKCIKMRREFSRLYARITNYKEAIALKKDNVRLLKNSELTNALAQEYGDLGGIYLEAGIFDSSGFYFKEALKISRKHKNAVYEILSINNLGFYYDAIGDKKKAIEYYKEGIIILEGRGELSSLEQTQLGLLRGNLGGIYLKNGQADKGIPLLEYDLKENLHSKEPGIAINAARELARHYYKIGQFEKALSALRQTLTIESKVGDSLLYTEVYHQLFRNSLAKGDNSSAKRYYERFNILRKASTAKQEAERLGIEKSLLNNILTAQLEYQKKELELRSIENEALQAKNRYVQMRSLVISIAVLIVLIFGFMYVRKRISVLQMTRKLAEQELKIERIEKERIDNELKHKNKDLTDFAIDISRKQEVLEELKTKLYELRNQKLDELETKRSINELIQYTNNNLVVDSQLQEFQQNIEEVNYRFFDALKERFPDLTELDKQVCGLIRLGLSNKEIAVMRNVSYKAVRMSRYRLRKKMNLDEEEDIVEFLKSI